MKASRRVALGAAGGIAVPVIVEAVSAQLRKRVKAEILEQPDGSARQVLVAFPAFANDAVSIEDLLPFFGSINAILVNYSRTGHESNRLFEEIVRRLRRYGDAELVLFGVSFGAGVAIAFRRYLQSRPELASRFRSVRFIFYSPVTSRWDLEPKKMAAAALGFVLLGGWVSNAIWGLTGGSKRLHRNKPPFEIEITPERLAQIHASVDKSTVSLLASEARAILLTHKPAYPGEFEDDVALIFAFRHDFVMERGTPGRLAKSFGWANVVWLAGSGHADIYRTPSIGLFMQPAIAKFISND